MSEVVATAEHVLRTPADRVRAALADYVGARRRAMPEQFTDYRVEAGGAGAGTRVHWRFAATSKRVRDQVLAVTAPDPATLVESDANSSMVTTWTVEPAGAGASSVRVRTTWNGAGGVGGTDRPGGHHRGIQVLLDQHVRPWLGDLHQLLAHPLRRRREAPVHARSCALAAALDAVVAELLGQQPRPRALVVGEGGEHALRRGADDSFGSGDDLAHAPILPSAGPAARRDPRGARHWVAAHVAGTPVG